MDFNSVKNEVKELSLEDYNQLFEILLNEQKRRFKDTLKNNRYEGERPILPTYEISVVQKEHLRPLEKGFFC